MPHHKGLWQRRRHSRCCSGGKGICFRYARLSVSQFETLKRVDQNAVQINQPSPALEGGYLGGNEMTDLGTSRIQQSKDHTIGRNRVPHKGDWILTRQIHLGLAYMGQAHFFLIYGGQTQEILISCPYHQRYEMVVTHREFMISRMVSVGYLSKDDQDSFCTPSA